MNCEWVKSVSAFDCVPVRGLHGEVGVEIGTPFSYADGTAIVFYSFEQNEHLLFTDNGEMLAHLSAIGLDPHKGKRITLLREKLDQFGLTLSDQGDVRALVPKSQGQYAFASTISGMLAVADWEHEQLGIDERTRNLADEAEIYLREWKPAAHLERKPKVKGQSKKDYSFDYLLGDELIDVVPANHTATGALMRKAGDILNSPFLAGRSIRVVIDDRVDPERAEVERQIMGSLVKAMLFTKLQQLASPIRH
jgi:hypothetical protein